MAPQFVVRGEDYVSAVARDDPGGHELRQGTEGRVVGFHGFGGQLGRCDDHELEVEERAVLLREASEPAVRKVAGEVVDRWRLPMMGSFHGPGGRLRPLVFLWNQSLSMRIRRMEKPAKFTYNLLWLFHTTNLTLNSSLVLVRFNSLVYGHSVICFLALYIRIILPYVNDIGAHTDPSVVNSNRSSRGLSLRTSRRGRSDMASTLAGGGRDKEEELGFPLCWRWQREGRGVRFPPLLAATEEQDPKRWLLQEWNIPKHSLLEEFELICEIPSILEFLPASIANSWSRGLYGREGLNTGHGHSPLNRPLQIYLRCGVINIDKSSHLSSHQVAKKIKDIMGAKKTGHGDILRCKVTGSLVYMNSSTRLIKYLQEASMEFICIALLHPAVPDTRDVARVIKTLTGLVLQCPPVKGRLLRNPTIHDSELLGYDPQKLLVRFWISCEVGTNVEKHCAHLGLLLGVSAYMHELRRARPGFLGEHGNMFTIQNVEHAMKSYKVSKDERYLRKIVMPVEVLLTGFKRLVVRDSVVFVLCH
ncbi:H/ACA ribonucleoprotein complex subunit 4 [Platanthera guangdongensis]|uniref:H/ACA ribonucleoprotein complex subunit 4 n=1 Tax=Platanthera guangdongensis TaxID=2320717 RepID=A0ABR2MC98_9ASPA